jgi:(p)ppGpp synthase/HD superfamily hydrolase
MKTGYALIAEAAAFAAKMHGRDTRKDLNEAYICHPLRVGAMAAERGCIAEFIAACYLHDVVEDTSATMDDLKHFPDHTRALVLAVTKTWKGTDDAKKALYYAGIHKQAGAPLLKTLDRIDNLNDMVRTVVSVGTPSVRRWAQNYLAKTMAEFPSIVGAVQDAHVRALYDTTLARVAAVLAEDK